MPRIPLLIAAFATFLVSALAVAKPASKTISPSEIRAGMKGYGLTVFRGQTPERFAVEVIDVLKRFRPDQDLILIKTHHPVLERAKVVAGMSGSPIYLDGRLAGAYAYGWPFGTEPVAGVTPIANMLAEIDRPLDPRIWKALGTLPGGPGPKASAPQARRNPSGLPPYLGGERRGAFDTLRKHAELRGYSQKGAQVASQLRILPAATPIMLGGFTDATAALLSDELESFGLLALQAGGSAGTGAKPVKGARYVDGGAVGVQLVRGDVSATAIGTVTHVNGKRSVGFGHPMMNMGQTALPTSTARVLHILASQRRSFKIAEAVQPLGALVHDRQAAIVVDSSLQAETVPLTIKVVGAPSAPRTTWKMEVASHRSLTGPLVFAATLNALRATVSDRTDVTFSVRSKVRVEGQQPVQIVDKGYSGVGVAHPYALSRLRLFDVIAAAYGNPFERARVLGVDIQLELEFGQDVLSIIDVLTPSRQVDPGSDINLYVTLRRFGGAEQVRVVPVHVPASAAGEKIDIRLAPGDSVRLEHPKPRSLKQVIQRATAGYPATSIVISTRLPSRGLRMRGHVVRALPGSALDTLQLQNSSDRPTSFITYDRQELDMGHIMSGSAKLQLEVREEPRR